MRKIGSHPRRGGAILSFVVTFSAFSFVWQTKEKVGFGAKPLITISHNPQQQPQQPTTHNNSQPTTFFNPQHSSYYNIPYLCPVKPNLNHPVIPNYLMHRIIQFPSRLTRVLVKNQGRLLKIILLVLVFITALYTKAYKGEFQGLINNHIGGVLYVLFGSLLFSAMVPTMKAYKPVLLALGITCLLECIQWMQIPFMVELTRFKTFAYLFGNSFNWGDFIYYFIGAGVGWLVLVGIKE